MWNLKITETAGEVLVTEPDFATISAPIKVLAGKYELKLQFEQVDNLEVFDIVLK